MEFELSLWHKLRQSLDIYKSSAWVFSYLYGLLYHKDTAVSVPFLDIHVKTCMFVLWRVLREANGFPYKHKTQISLRTMPKYNGMGVKSNNSTLTSARGVAKSAISQSVPFNSWEEYSKFLKRIIDDQMWIRKELQAFVVRHGLYPDFIRELSMEADRRKSLILEMKTKVEERKEYSNKCKRLRIC